MLILFGLSGSGKNYVGEILSKHFSFHFWDADNVLTPEMRNCIKNKEIFTQSMRDNFIAIIIQNVTELQKHHKNLVIAQAFYKEQNRTQIKTAFPAARLIHIQAKPELIAKRLGKSHEHDYLDYAQKISMNFESPNLPHLVLVNNTNEDDVIKQLHTLLEAEKKVVN